MRHAARVAPELPQACRATFDEKQQLHQQQHQQHSYHIPVVILSSSIRLVDVRGTDASAHTCAQYFLKKKKKKKLIGIYLKDDRANCNR